MSLSRLLHTGRDRVQPRTKEPPRGQTKGIMGGQFVKLCVLLGDTDMTLDLFKVTLNGFKIKPPSNVDFAIKNLDYFLEVRTTLKLTLSK